MIFAAVRGGGRRLKIRAKKNPRQGAATFLSPTTGCAARPISPAGARHIRRYATSSVRLRRSEGGGTLE